MPVVIAGLILSFLVMLLFGGTQADRGLLTLFDNADSQWLQQAAGAIVAASTPIPLLVAALAGAAYLLVRAHWRQALLLLAIILGGRLLVDGFQELAAGWRPGLDERLLPTQQIGFPNGHVANATITAISAAFLLSRHFPARTIALAGAAAFALAVGIGVLLLGGGWPSDVGGGWAIGLAWTLLVLTVARADLGDGVTRPRPQPDEPVRSGLSED